MPDLQKIEGSSTIDAVGYDQDRQALTIRFHSGGTYEFANVPETVHDELLAAPSVGRHFHARIRGCYPAIKLF